MSFPLHSHVSLCHLRWVPTRGPPDRVTRPVATKMYTWSGTPLTVIFTRAVPPPHPIITVVALRQPFTKNGEGSCALPRRKTIFKWVELNSSVFWVITRCKVTWNRSFGTTYRYHLQGSGSPSWTAWPSNMRPTCSPETSVSNQLTTRNNPGDRIIRVTTATFLSHECPV